MKCPNIFLIIPALLAVTSPGSAEAAEENGLTGVLWERLVDPNDAFYPSLRVGLEYDDNIHLAVSDEQQGSWKTILEPGVKFDLPGEQTSLLFEYSPIFFIYWNRDNRYDIDYTAFIEMEHNFDRRNKIRITNLFLRQESPRDTIRVIVPGYREADYYSNALNIRYRHRPTRQVIWGINYENERHTYDANVMKRYFNRTANSASSIIQYQFSRQLRLKSSYAFRRMKYDQRDRDYQLHLIRAGFNWLINRQVTAELFTGYNHHRQDSGEKVTGPYIESVIEAIVSPDLFLNISYQHIIQDDPADYQPSRLGHNLEASAAYNLLPRLILGLDYLARLTYFHSRPGTEDDRDMGSDLFWQSELYAVYRVNPITNLKLGWQRTENNSTQSKDNYFRHQIYLEVSTNF